MAKDRIKKNRWRLLHQYYSYTGFYRFIIDGVKKASLPLILVVVALVYVNYEVIKINDLLKILTEKYDDLTIFSVFFISESILGLLPPDIFIAWTKNTNFPILYLAVLAILSYIGGVISYILGKAMLLIPSIQKYMEEKMAKHIINMRKWGGLLIAAGALLPLPFAIAAMAAGMIRFDFRNFLLFSVLRFLRFVIYGFAIYQMLN
ncbi:YqaA family protein [Flavobacterium sp. UBA6135]|uniref:YqaA family protein n=1 Tax=Flavobacterium sp. UBA6135 TaxID=1946553 RepID=UPI0025BDED45|nr:VTT domain-containing protein [Flavobacterium sp. UBA6135]